MSPNLIPALDAAGLPGPPWLFHVLLVFTFFLHLVFMNLTLGGTLLAAFSHMRSGGRKDDYRGVLSGRLMAINNYGISLTITTGVAPLLFIQLIYQPFFYSATILLAPLWLSMLLLLTVGYYSAYLYKFRGAPARGQGGGLWLGLSAVMFLAIAMIHVAVHLVHAQPEKWGALADGAWCVLADPTYWPRLLHFVLAGIGFSALVTAWWAVRRVGEGIEVAINTDIARWAWRWALWTTVFQVVDGFVLLAVLPGPGSPLSHERGGSDSRPADRGNPHRYRPLVDAFESHESGRQSRAGDRHPCGDDLDRRRDEHHPSSGASAVPGALDRRIRFSDRAAVGQLSGVRPVAGGRVGDRGLHGPSSSDFARF